MAIPNTPETNVVENVVSLWQKELQAAGCSHCGQAFLIESTQQGTLCPNFLSNNLEPQPVRLRRDPPELQVPFQVTSEDLGVTLANFVRPVWLKPDDLNPQVMLQRARPIFWPMWLVDSVVSGHWQAEMGFDYQVKSSQENFHRGQWQTREQIETRIRWEPRTGEIQRRYENIAAPALNQQNELQARLGSYRLDQAVPYTAASLGAGTAWVPDLQTENAWPGAQLSLNRAAEEEVRQAGGAQHVRNFAIQAQYKNLNWTQLLLPMYVSYYHDDAGQPIPVLINGQSGKISGLLLASQAKGWQWAGITLAVALGLFLIGLLLTAAATLLPPAAAIGALLMVLAFVTGILAIIPAAWPWQWNRNQRSQAVKASGERT